MAAAAAAAAAVADEKHYFDTKWQTAEQSTGDIVSSNSCCHVVLVSVSAPCCAATPANKGVPELERALHFLFVLKLVFSLGQTTHRN